MEKAQNFFVYYRLKIAFIGVMLYCLHKSFDLHDKPYSFDSDLLGLFGFSVVVSGLLLRSWAAGIVVKNKMLTTVGPYSIWRHPLYIGSLLLTAGFCIILDDWFLWLAVLALTLFVYRPKIKKEERKLMKVFPDEWQEYSRNVGVLLVRKIRPNTLAANWSFGRWLGHKEYNAWIASAIAVAIIEVWHGQVSA